ncbi:hypothetical protein SAMN02745166_01220 [Prosthecobacter debontii]|uniref:Alpha/beta hydrolase family protein n=1 Tax=Prosthecobacter debontii TaxID=48467 RepID=A0A1T4XAJ6_9BACT|nr:hypothetical protein [Prosthecobacter debontii]SKA85901.1 hypothetical protein SAMN02745166_01220 [Prosthecobacter debontii]
MRLLLYLFLLLSQGLLPAQAGKKSWPDLSSVPPDLTLPALTEGRPRAGCWVRQTTAHWQGTEVYHLLYLPTDWKPDRSWPVIVEYPGNGPFQNAFGDTSTGKVEGCCLGYGISAGRGFIWISMPFVEKAESTQRNATRWWGDLDVSKRYCIETVRAVCQNFHGDPQRVLLSGFSRGSIACNYLGLHDDEIVSLWCGFICHSHYDGVKTWPYPDSDRGAAHKRLLRLGQRPQFISHEGSIDATRDWLLSTGINGRWTLVPLPFRNHSNAWVLRDLPERQRLRQWVHEVMPKK